MKPTRLTLALPLAGLLALPAAAQHVLAHHGVGSGLLGVDDAEFTPDGSLIVARDNTDDTTALVYDAATGAEIFRFEPSIGPPLGGVVEDAVVTTNDRAVVIGKRVMFLDLNNLAASPYAMRDAGPRPRDVMLTPDETILAVRGDSRQFLYDMATGSVLGSRSGTAPAWNPTAFEVDSVVTTNDHAVFTSVFQGSTRVTVWDLHPSGGGAPAMAYETTAGTDQAGIPHDIEVTPDGNYAVVRSDFQVGLYALNGAASTQAWLKGLNGGLADSFGGSAMDSIVATDTMVATISRRVSAGIGAQLDVWTIPVGDNKAMLLDGDPHDLALTPNGERMAVRTHKKLYLFDVDNLPPHPIMTALDEVKLLGDFTSWSAGLDSVFVTEDRVLAVSRKGSDSKVRVYDISADTLDKVFGTWLGEPATDVIITPDRNRAVVSGRTSGMVVDLRLNEVVLDHDPLFAGTFGWCDGVAVTNDQAVVFGVETGNWLGWLSVIDLFSRAQNFCPTTDNSTGQPGELVATGSSRVGSNDLTLTSIHLPTGQFGQFFYGDQTQQAPFGDGFVCIAGQLARFPVLVVGADGRAALAVDSGNLPPGGGALMPGTTWYFQFIHRDTMSLTGNFNLTDAVSVLFE
jgi:hypothetical protein